MEKCSKKFFAHDTTVKIIPEKVTAAQYVNKLADEFTKNGKDDAFFVCHIGQILRQHEIWMQNLPRFQPYYAVKCNDDPLLLTVLAQLGCSFDCASKGEINTILSMGVGPDRIIYANPCKTASFIRHASDMGVTMMTFDNEPELRKVQKLHSEAKLVLRLAVSDPTAVCRLSLKFGCEPVEEAAHLLKLAAKLGVEVVGISFHVGSGCRDPTAYATAIEHARRLFDLGQLEGHHMHILDIGGGFPGTDNHGITLSQIAAIVNESIEKHFPRGCGVKLIAEPGRFYAAAAYNVCVNVIAKREIPASKITGDDKDAQEPGYMYYVNDGVYGSFNCIMFDHAHPKGEALNKNAPETWCNVWGPTCDSMDLIDARCRLPELNVGDWIMFQEHGAYTMAAASCFNGFQKPQIHYVLTKNDWAKLKALVTLKSRSRPKSWAPAMSSSRARYDTVVETAVAQEATGKTRKQRHCSAHEPKRHEVLVAN